MLDWLFGPSVPPTIYIPDNQAAKAFRQRYNLTCEVGCVKEVLFHYRLDPSEEQLQRILGRNENPNLGFRGDYAALRGDLVNYGAHAPAIKRLVGSYPQAGVFAGLLLRSLEQARAALARNWLGIVWIPVGLMHSYRVAVTLSTGEVVTLVPGEHTITLHAYDGGGFYVYDPRPNQRVPDYVPSEALARGMALFDYPALAVQPLF